MPSRPRTLTVLLAVFAVLVAALATAALASPDGDDDPTYNAGDAFGTRYTLVSGGGNTLTGARPATDTAPDGSSVTAALLTGRELSRGSFSRVLHVSRLGPDGLPTSAPVAITVNTFAPDEVLDTRVLSGGDIVVVIRGRGELNADPLNLFTIRIPVDGSAPTQRIFTACDLEEEEAPSEIGRGDEQEYDKRFPKAARVEANGDIAALWDCERAGESTRRDVFVTRYASAASGGEPTETQPIPNTVYGADLELGPGGDPYVLVQTFADDVRLALNQSTVFRLTQSGLTLTPLDGSVRVGGLPIDLAVDSQSRPVVWTDGSSEAGDWFISRLTADLTALDSTWGSGGTAAIDDPRLAFPLPSADYGNRKKNFLTVRPGDKVLALGGYTNPESDRVLDSSVNGIIAGLTASGQLDTGFATNGFKEFEYDDEHIFARIGEPTLQSDGKVLVPHTHFENFNRSAQRIAPPPGDGQYVGVTRLRGLGGAAQVTGAAGPAGPGAVTPSGTPAVCGRRAISLVRADVRGRRVRLTGLVGAALYGKQVTIQTDPKGAKSSKFTKTTTVRASRTTGSFTASVPKPKRSDFVSTRYRAVSGRAKSPALKLPQRLTSRSVKAAAGKITVKGRVKKSVLGKRNKVLVRRLVCGRYRTVGSARADASGSYTVTFRSTQIRGVSFYRAETRVLRKAGSKRYVTQYARAIAIRTTAQTG